MEWHPYLLAAAETLTLLSPNKKAEIKAQQQVQQLFLIKALASLVRLYYTSGFCFGERLLRFLRSLKGTAKSQSRLIVSRVAEAFDVLPFKRH